MSFIALFQFSSAAVKTLNNNLKTSKEDIPRVETKNDKYFITLRKERGIQDFTFPFENPMKRYETYCEKHFRKIRKQYGIEIQEKSTQTTFPPTKPFERQKTFSEKHFAKMRKRCVAKK